MGERGVLGAPEAAEKCQGPRGGGVLHQEDAGVLKFFGGAGGKEKSRIKKKGLAKTDNRGFQGEGCL